MSKYKKSCIGFIFSKSQMESSDEMLIDYLKKNSEIMFIPIENCNILEHLKDMKNFPIFLNYSCVSPNTLDGLEITKTLESFGKRVINSSESFYYCEDKWMFYLNCVKNKIPTPKTWLIQREGGGILII